MSTELHEIEALRGKLQITQFAGPVQVGPMLQLTQGLAGSIIGEPDDLGAIQLTLAETATLVPKLVAWMRDESKRRAEILRKKIAEDKALEKTIFSEAAECERFIAEFEIPALCVSQLARIVATPNDKLRDREAHAYESKQEPIERFSAAPS